MGFLDSFQRLFGGESGPDVGRDVAELARRLRVPEEELRAVRPKYARFTIPKAKGGERTIHAPDAELKKIQRRILRGVLDGLFVHPAAHGFERDRSIVTNARPHAGKAVVLRFDVRDFFDSTGADRVTELFRRVGWNREASAILTQLTTHKGGLPQGAPTSPRLSNLVNVRLDDRLAALAAARGGDYTRYADDLTFSFAADDRRTNHELIRAVKAILADTGYALHQGPKLKIRRRHQAQVVTGLVVNDGVRLPRRVRRWLRAVEHRSRVAQDRPPTLSAAEIEGWRAFRRMIERGS